MRFKLVYNIKARRKVTLIGLLWFLDKKNWPYFSRKWWELFKPFSSKRMIYVNISIYKCKYECCKFVFFTLQFIAGYRSKLCTISFYESFFLCNTHNMMSWKRNKWYISFVPFYSSNTPSKNKYDLRGS